MTLLQIRDYLTMKAGIQGNRMFPQARLNQIINFARKFVQINLNGLGYKRWEKSATLTPMASISFGSIRVRSSDIPSDMLESSQSIILLQTSDDTIVATTKQEYSPSQFENVCANSFSAPTVKEPAYTRLANYILLFPETIISAVVYYYGALVDLVDDSDPSGVPVEFEEYVIQKALVEIQGDLSAAFDKAKGDQEVVASLGNAYQKFLGVVQQKQVNQKQKEAGVIQ